MTSYLSTYEKYELIYSTLQEPENQKLRLSQKRLAELLELSPSTISRVVTHPLFTASFTVDAYNAIRVVPTTERITPEQFQEFTYRRIIPNTRQSNASRQSREDQTIEELMQLLADKIPPQAETTLTEFYAVGNSYNKFLAAAMAHQAKLEGRPYDSNQLLTPAELQERLSGVEAFAARLLKLALAFKSAEHYGNENWWLDWVETGKSTAK